MRLLAACFLPPSEPFRRLPPRSRNPRAPEQRSGAGSQLLSPEHRPQLLAWPSLLGRGLPAGPRPPTAHSCRGVRAQRTRQSWQQGNKEQPAHHHLISCRKYLTLAFWVRALRDLRGGEPVPHANPNAVPKEKTAGRAERVPVFGLSICRSYGHGRCFYKPDEGISVWIWF